MRGDFEKNQVKKLPHETSAFFHMDKPLGKTFVLVFVLFFVSFPVFAAVNPNEFESALKMIEDAYRRHASERAPLRIAEAINEGKQANASLEALTMARTLFFIRHQEEYFGEESREGDAFAAAIKLMSQLDSTQPVAYRETPRGLRIAKANDPSAKPGQKLFLKDLIYQNELGSINAAFVPALVLRKLSEVSGSDPRHAPESLRQLTHFAHTTETYLQKRSDGQFQKQVHLAVLLRKFLLTVAASEGKPSFEFSALQANGGVKSAVCNAVRYLLFYPTDQNIEAVVSFKKQTRNKELLQGASKAYDLAAIDTPSLPEILSDYEARTRTRASVFSRLCSLMLGNLIGKR